MRLTGSQIVIECLREQGVDTIFGYPGGAILNIYDELYKHSDEIRHVLTSHEQGASHAADGYARSTGKVGVVFSTSGPGATNLVTGLATANIDSVPVVAVCCNVGTSLLGKDSFQEVNITSVTKAVTKKNYIVMDVRELADTIREAFYTARSGRPGAVLIDIPKDVTAAKTEYTPKEPQKIAPVTEGIREEDIDAAAELIRNAKRPFIFVGGGAVISGASRALKEFAHLIDSPVCDSLMGKGVFPGTDRLYAGMLGMHGTKTANFGVSESDLLIAVGTRFSDRVYGNANNFAPGAKKLQIDIDPKEINKNVKVDATVMGDARTVLETLNERLTQQNHSEWIAKIEENKKKFPLNYRTDILTGPAIVDAVYRLTKGDAIITTEVGQHQMWAAQFYCYTKPRTFITSGGLGTMGYGLGASMGAKCAFPDKTVVNIAGDGGFRMNLNEIASAVRNNIPIIEVVINNKVLGMVRQWQDLFYGKRYSHTVLDDDVDFAGVAQAMGAEGITVRTLGEFEDAFNKAKELKRAVVIDCIIDKDEKVWPMVAPGESISRAFSREDM